MKKLMLVGLLVGSIALATGCSKETPTTPQPPVAQNTPATQTPAPATTPTTPTTVASGKDIYDKNCSGCHGAGGAGASAPALNKEKFPLAEVVDVTKKGKGSMPGYATSLSSAEIQAVSQYVVDLTK